MPDRPLKPAEVADLADRIAGLLGDPDAHLTPSARARWEGALTALSYVLGDVSRLPADDPGRFEL